MFSTDSTHPISSPRPPQSTDSLAPTDSAARDLPAARSAVATAATAATADKAEFAKDPDRLFDFNYRAANNALYPIRVRGKPMFVAAMGVQSVAHVPSNSSRGPFQSGLVRPFLESGQSAEHLGARYDDLIEVVQYRADDLPDDPRFRACQVRLLHRPTVIAKRLIRAGACIGVLGGEVVPLDTWPRLNVEYVLPAAPVSISADQCLVMLGDNAMAQIPTTVGLDEDGYFQAEDGFNIEPALFDVELFDEIEASGTCCKRLRVMAFFAKNDILAGEKLAYNQRLSPAVIEKLIGETGDALPVDLDILKNTQRCTVAEAFQRAGLPTTSADYGLSVDYDLRYRPANDGLYPLRWEGVPLRIWPELSFRCSVMAELYPLEGVRPFLDLTLAGAERAGLYRRLVAVKEFTVKDVSEKATLRPYDLLRVGSDQLVAARNIERGQCIGVMGGELIHMDRMRDEFAKHLTEFGDNLWSTATDNSQAILHDNILSKMNSILVVNSDRSWQEAERGYNVERISIEITYRGGGWAKLYLPAFFANQAIKKGRELRVNLGCTPAGIAARIADLHRSGRKVTASTSSVGSGGSLALAPQPRVLTTAKRQARTHLAKRR